MVYTSLFTTLEDESHLTELFRKRAPAAPESVSFMNPYLFAHTVGTRIYLEWLDEEDSKHRVKRVQSGYNGEAFSKFVDDEVQYLLSRQHIAKKRAHPQANDHADYLAVRAHVLEGIVACAIACLAESKSCDAYGWKQPLRCDLQPWIGE